MIPILAYFNSLFSTFFENSQNDPKWLISDLFLKNPKSSNFGKILWAYFSSSKTDQKTNFCFFVVDAISEKLQNWIHILFFSKLSIFQVNIPLSKFVFNFAIFRKLRRQKKQKFVFSVSFWRWKICPQNFPEIRTFRIF